MQMRSCGISRRADIRDRLARYHRIPSRTVQRTRVRIPRCVAVSVVYKHTVAVAVHPRAVSDRTAVRRCDRLAVYPFARNIDPAVSSEIK